MPIVSDVNRHRLRVEPAKLNGNIVKIDGWQVSITDGGTWNMHCLNLGVYPIVLYRAKIMLGYRHPSGGVIDTAPNSTIRISLEAGQSADFQFNDIDRDLFFYSAITAGMGDPDDSGGIIDGRQGMSDSFLFSGFTHLDMSWNAFPNQGHTNHKIELKLVG